MLFMAKDLEPGEQQGPLGCQPNGLRPPDRTPADRRESPSEPKGRIARRFFAQHVKNRNWRAPRRPCYKRSTHDGPLGPETARLTNLTRKSGLTTILPSCCRERCTRR